MVRNNVTLTVEGQTTRALVKYQEEESPSTPLKKTRRERQEGGGVLNETDLSEEKDKR